MRRPRYCGLVCMSIFLFPDTHRCFIHFIRPHSCVFWHVDYDSAYCRNLHAMKIFIVACILNKYRALFQQHFLINRHVIFPVLDQPLSIFFFFDFAPQARFVDVFAIFRDIATRYLRHCLIHCVYLFGWFV